MCSYYTLKIVLFTTVCCVITILDQVSADSNRVKYYSKWTKWTSCPIQCDYDCEVPKLECKQSRRKTCLIPQACGDMIQEQQRSCGGCAASLLVSKVESDQVTLNNHCLTNNHFTNWSDWSKCVQECRRVRYRQCLSLECRERVENMEDAAVKDQEWCLPEENKSSCIVMLNMNHPQKQMNFLECEQLRQQNIRRDERGKKQTSRTKIDYIRLSKKKPRPEMKVSQDGHVLHLGVPCGQYLDTNPLKSIRIVGGSPVRGNRWKWQVAIMMSEEKGTYNDFPAKPRLDIIQPEFVDESKYYQYCGGTLVAPQWVLTAAHCVQSRETGLRKKNIVVMTGQSDMRVMRNQSDTRWQRGINAITQVIVHKGFDWTSVDNDIALIKLEKAVYETERTGYSCVPKEDLEPSPGTHCVAVGWGKVGTGQHSKASKILREVTLPIVDRETCKNAFNFTVTENQMCAGDGQGDSCDGDSGGPLMCLARTKNNQLKWVVNGIISYGPKDGCGVAGKYGVYVKVNNYSKWIRRTLKANDPSMLRTRASKKERRAKRRRHKKAKQRLLKHASTASPLLASELIATTNTHYQEYADLTELLLQDSR